MIRMISGSTYIDGQLISAASGAFSADKTVEKRLVDACVAEYVGESIVTGSAAESASPENGDGNSFSIPEYSKNSSKTELQSIAKTYGVDFIESDTKEALMKKLDDFFADALTAED